MHHSDAFDLKTWLLHAQTAQDSSVCKFTPPVTSVLMSHLTLQCPHTTGSTVAAALRSRLTGLASLAFLWTGTSGSSSEESGPRTSLCSRRGGAFGSTSVAIVLMVRDLPSPHAFQGV